VIRSGIAWSAPVCAGPAPAVMSIREAPYPPFSANARAALRRSLLPVREASKGPVAITYDFPFAFCACRQVPGAIGLRVPGISTSWPASLKRDGRMPPRQRSGGGWTSCVA